jgi:hypothetical protein
MLCRKAGIPINDVRGRITSHRARSTIASQLFNAKEPMTLFELQEWLGHSSPEATQHYVKTTPTKLAKSYADAGYFARNLRAIEVLIDQESVRNGRAATEPWKFYDLGHGYCTYDFFDQCPHRIACAKCSFYLPKDSTKGSFWKLKRTWCDCARIYRWPTRNSQLWKMDLPRTNNYSQSWPTYRRQQDRLPGNSAESISCNCRWVSSQHDPTIGSDPRR